MITLMLACALAAIGLLAVLPEIGQQIKRDREEELRHRGTAYMRAIRNYYKKLGRYPSRVEDLESTNNLRFLRKRYKDPMSRDRKTGKERDFKFLHVTDIGMNNPALAGQLAGLAGLQGQVGTQGQGQGQGLIQKQTGLGQAALGALATQAQMAGSQSSGLNANDAQDSGDSGNPSAESDAGNNSNSSTSSPNGTPGSPSASGFNGPAYGTGAILGVASTSKEKSIRVFFEKNHYKDWLFVYVPMIDRGGLLVGPVQPGMPTGGGLAGAYGQAPGVAAGQNQGQTVPQGGGQNPPAQNQPQTPDQ
jgi:type II secretory pathway pseudopilin PulG